ncbi:hypothetical protein V1281_005827 [Nitrobacteraceae bacterium AZCC 2161]
MSFGQKNSKSLQHSLADVGEVLDHGVARRGAIAVDDRIDNGEVLAAGGQQAFRPALHVAHPDFLADFTNELFQRSIAAVLCDLIVDFVIECPVQCPGNLGRGDDILKPGLDGLQDVDRDAGRCNGRRLALQQQAQVNKFEKLRHSDISDNHGAIRKLFKPAFSQKSADAGAKRGPRDFQAKREAALFDDLAWGEFSRLDQVVQLFIGGFGNVSLGARPNGRSVSLTARSDFLSTGRHGNFL